MKVEHPICGSRPQLGRPKLDDHRERRLMETSE